MIISRFGDTWDAAYAFSTLKGADDYQTIRQASIGQVGGMSGVFDFWGSGVNPLAAQVVTKRFELSTFRSGTISGAGQITTDGSTTIVGTSTHFMTEVIPGSVITWFEGSRTVVNVTDNTHLIVSSNADSTGEPVDYTITYPGWNGLETLKDQLKAATIGIGESKLWGLLRDGTTHRWAWAKCNRLRAPEDYNTRLHLPVELDFLLREGLWYGETQGGQSITQASATYTLTNSGTQPANVVVQVTSSTGTLTSMAVSNAANGDDFTWTGSATVGQLLKVDTGAWLVTKAGSAAYSGLTYGTGQNNWLRLNPGSNVITVTIAGSTAWSGSITWWDTYL